MTQSTTHNNRDPWDQPEEDVCVLPLRLDLLPPVAVASEPPLHVRSGRRSAGLRALAIPPPERFSAIPPPQRTSAAARAPPPSGSVPHGDGNAPKPTSADKNEKVCCFDSKENYSLFVVVVCIFIFAAYIYCNYVAKKEEEESSDDESEELLPRRQEANAPPRSGHIRHNQAVSVPQSSHAPQSSHPQNRQSLRSLWRGAITNNQQNNVNDNCWGATPQYTEGEWEGWNPATWHAYRGN